MYKSVYTLKISARLYNVNPFKVNFANYMTKLLLSSDYFTGFHVCVCIKQNPVNIYIFKNDHLWERVWSNFSLKFGSSSYSLQVIHRAYITPYKRFKMKLQSNLNCHICNTASSGTFLHMFWECPVVISLWTHVNLVLSSLL